MRLRFWTMAALVMASASSRLGAAEAVTLAGRDRAVVLLPPGAPVESYRNAGYRLQLRDGLAEIEVELDALDSREPFLAPKAAGDEPIGSLALALVAGSQTRFDAVGRILAWVARNVLYDSDRQRSQAPLEVLQARSGYCTGVARLSVALLAAVGIPAREVAGYVFAQPNGVGEYHRWIEVHYADRGWTFSDPHRTHQYVPATYLRLAGETVDLDQGTQGVLLERQSELRAIDVYPGAPEWISVRRNHERRYAGALRVMAPGGRLELAGGGLRRIRQLDGQAAVFLGLAPGEYVLSWQAADRPPLTRRLSLHGPVEAQVDLTAQWRGDAGVEGP